MGPNLPAFSKVLPKPVINSPCPVEQGRGAGSTTAREEVGWDPEVAHREAGPPSQLW